MALKAFFNLFGVGRKKENKETLNDAAHKNFQKPPVRQHPYEEVSDDDLDSNRAKVTRVHPYDEISTEELEANRQGTPARSHPYDDISDEHLNENRNKLQQRKHPYESVRLEGSAENAQRKENPGKKNVGAKNDVKKSTSGKDLNYAEVEVKPNGRPGKDAKSHTQEGVIYSNVRESTAEERKAIVH